MDWFKLSSNGVLRGSLSQSKDIVQITWIKLLALMNESHARNGRFEFAPGKPYPLEYIAVNCGISKEILEGCLCEYEEDLNLDDGLPRIQWDNDTLLITNWDKYQNNPDNLPPRKKHTQEEIDKATVRNAVRNPALAHKAENLNGATVVDAENKIHLPNGDIVE